jgi:uncharacterized protein (TIGR03083 family)
MDRDQVWQCIDAERQSLADLFDELDPAEWETPSLCVGWRVRDVAAHLTLSQTGVLDALVGLVRAGGNLNRMIRDSARRQAALPTTGYAPLLRAMAGSRRTAPGVTHLEPLIDVLVHGQDITVPLGRPRPMPPAAAVAAASRVWPNLWPFRAQRRLPGFTFTATDADFSAGHGARVEGPIGTILLLLTGRPAALVRLSGPGMAELTARLSPARTR